MNPLITVIVPVYKVEKYLPRCIESIINQTYQNLEIILVDDGSPDNSGKICDEYAKKDNRIKVIHKDNGGQATARNAALDIANGEYIGFVDSDDWIFEDMYEYLYGAIDTYNADIAVCGAVFGTIVNKRIIQYGTMFRAHKTETLDTVQTIKAHCKIKLGFAPWNKLYSKRIWEDIRFPACFREDEAVMYKLLAKSKKTVCLTEAKYFYFQRKGSSERNGYNEKYLISLETADKTYEFIKSNYPQAEKEAWDLRVQMRILQLEDIISFGSMDKYKRITDSLVDFLKGNIAYSEGLRNKAETVVCDRKKFCRNFKKRTRKYRMRCRALEMVSATKIYKPLKKIKRIILN